MINVDLRSYALFWCLLLSCVGISFSAHADEAEPATRSIRFVLEDEPYVTAMPEDYQPQEDLRYAAVVRGFAPLLLSDAAGGGPPALQPINIPGLLAIAALDPSRGGARLRESVQRGALQRRFQTVLIHDYEPDIAAPGGPHVAINGHLANMIGTFRGGRGVPPAVQFLNHFTPAEETRPPLQEYVLLARSVDEAKQFAGDFVHAHDQGFVPWLRKLTQELKAALEGWRDKAEPKVAELDKQIASLAKELEGVEQLGEQAISDLKVKRTLLKVDLAGVEARAKTIEEKLKEATDRGLTQLGSKLVDLKVSADIERASLAAQEKTLDELIDGQRKSRKLGELQHKRLMSAEPIQTAVQGLPRCDEILADLKPFQLVNETVVIRPLRFRAE